MTEIITYHNAVVKFCAEQIVLFEAAGQEFRYPFKKKPYFVDGSVGRLRRDPAKNEYTFCAYPDQRLRRAPEDDIKREGVDLWGWTIQDANEVPRAFLVKAGVIPGKEGRVVDDETQPVEIAVPPEFFELCEEKGVTVEQVLRGFIADLCGLQNYIVLPREDGYCSNGSDERGMAEEYFARTYFGRTYL